MPLELVRWKRECLIPGFINSQMKVEKESRETWSISSSLILLTTMTGLLQIKPLVWHRLGSHISISQLRHSFIAFWGSGERAQQYSRGEGGRAKEAQSKFLVLMEDAIRQLDLAKSVQRYQLVVDELKVQLNLAVYPRAWLMPSRMIINVDNTAGYYNKLKQAVGMKLGVNNSVNQETKRVGVKLMDGGGSKVKRLTGHPSNLIDQKSMK